MVLARDLDLSGLQVLDRLVGAPVAHVHLEGARPEGQGQKLVADANAEHRQAVLQQALDSRHSIGRRRRRIAGAVGEEDAVRLVSQDFIGAGGGRDHGDAAAGGGEAAQDVALGAIVHRYHMVTGPRLAAVARAQGPGCLVPGVGLAAGHVRDQVHALKAGPGGGGGGQAIDIDIASASVDQRAVGSAAVADAPCQPARVDAGDGGQAVRAEPVVERARRPPARGCGDGLAQNASPDRRRRRLDVFGVGADVTDVGEGEGDDLAGVGGIGEDFLIAGHRGIEADLAHRLADGPGAPAPEYRSVGQHEGRVGARRPFRRRRRQGGGEGLGHGRRSLENQWRLDLGPGPSTVAAPGSVPPRAGPPANRRCNKQKPRLRQDPLSKKRCFSRR